MFFVVIILSIISTFLSPKLNHSKIQLISAIPNKIHFVLIEKYFVMKVWYAIIEYFASK